jgi:DNA-binding LytR/AlgR family response regulator
MQPEVSTLDVSMRGQLRTVRLDDILYFKDHKADGHPLMLHMRNDTAMIDGDIDTFEKILSKSFLRLNLSCLINKKNILYINKKTSSLEMPDGCTFVESKNVISNLFNELATNLINPK